MVKVKALLTNNTSTVGQSILAGILIDNNYTLQEYNKPKYEAYTEKRNRIFQALDKYIGSVEEDWARKVRWNKPNGGFFIKMEVPFEVNDEVLMDCVKNYGVIFCPMNYFYLDAGEGMHEIRLTFSNLSLQEIDAGIRNFAAFLREKVTRHANSVEDQASIHL
jgi:(S)-3,5-dihydroxyphenylglycine transaminase